MRAVKQKVWNEAEKTEPDRGLNWGRACEARALRARKTHALSISLLFLRKKLTVLQSSTVTKLIKILTVGTAATLSET